MIGWGQGLRCKNRCCGWWLGQESSLEDSPKLRGSVSTRSLGDTHQFRVPYEIVSRFLGIALTVPEVRGISAVGRLQCLRQVCPWFPGVKFIQLWPWTIFIGKFTRFSPTLPEALGKHMRCILSTSELTFFGLT